MRARMALHRSSLMSARVTLPRRVDLCSPCTPRNHRFPAASWCVVPDSRHSRLSDIVVGPRPLHLQQGSWGIDASSGETGAKLVFSNKGDLYPSTGFRVLGVYGEDLHSILKALDQVGVGRIVP